MAQATQTCPDRSDSKYTAKPFSCKCEAQGGGGLLAGFHLGALALLGTGCDVGPYLVTGTLGGIFQHDDNAFADTSVAVTFPAAYRPVGKSGFISGVVERSR